MEWCLLENESTVGFKEGVDERGEAESGEVGGDGNGGGRNFVRLTQLGHETHLDPPGAPFFLHIPHFLLQKTSQGEEENKLGLGLAVQRTRGVLFWVYVIKEFFNEVLLKQGWV